MRYFSFEDILHSHSLTRRALMQMLKNGELKAEKLQMSRYEPRHFKYIVSEAELGKLAEFRTSIPSASKNAQPDYYIQRWRKADKWRKKWQEDKQITEVHERRRNYYDYMHSEEWRKKRLKVLKRDGFRCQMCGTAKNLRVHHINYEHLGTDAELDDLITLCDTCHTQIHAQDIKKKQPLDLFSMPPTEGESKIELFQLALILLRNNSLSASQKWDRYNQACNSCTPPLSVKKYADIWLQAMKVVEDWRF